MESAFVKANFCPAEIEEISQLIAKGYGRSRSDVVRKATLEFITRHKENRRTIFRIRFNKQYT